jgi:REP-associated tyrosine transposase
MHNLAYKQFSRRHLPHVNPPGQTLFVTFRLVGSIPQALLRQYKAKCEWLQREHDRLLRLGSTETQKQIEQIESFKREWFIKLEEVLDQARTGPVWLKNENVAAAVANSLHDLDGKSYTLVAFCIMWNHVHTVFTPLLTESSLHEEFNGEGHLIFASDYPGLSAIMHRLKGRSAREANIALSRSGQFWEHESFDHVVRSGKLMDTVRYVLNNPVKAGLVKGWRDWRWSYCRNDLCDKL